MKRFAFAILLFSLFSCNQKKEKYHSVPHSEEIATLSSPQEAKQLMETHCYVCHSPSAAQNEGRIAPPMVAIKMRYLTVSSDKAEFMSRIAQFVDHPTQDNALMLEAVTRFNIMPKQVFPNGVIEKITEYMYEYQVEEPSWFKAHWKNSGLATGEGDGLQPGKPFVDSEKPKTLEETGLEYALATKAVLGKNLMEAIQTRGTLHALEFCNLQAIPLTDSMATRYQASIKRVSDKNRNPNNKANSQELKYLEQFKADVVAKRESKPVTLDNGNHVQFYYPIPTNTMCLQCHGKQIKPEVRQKILKLYPKDLAVDYDENEIRGIWSITFDKNQP